jgi:hypothetical protein
VIRKSLLSKRYTQLVEEGKWLSPSVLSLFEPITLHDKTMFTIPVAMH